MLFVKILLFFHVLGDFYFQTIKLSQLKRDKKWFLILHVAVYTALFIPLFWISTNILAVSLIIPGILISHFLCDYLMSKINNGNKNILLLLMDQSIHILILVIVWFILKDTIVPFSNLTNYLNQIGISVPLYKTTGVILVFLIIGRPASIFIETVLPKEAKEDIIIDDVQTIINEHPTPELLNQKELSIEGETIDDTQKNKINYGSLIGILERIIIVLLALLNLWSSIALIFTAKSIARFKQLEDKDFAQKYLIGTLLSLSITLVALLLFLQN